MSIRLLQAYSLKDILFLDCQPIARYVVNIGRFKELGGAFC